MRANRKDAQRKLWKNERAQTGIGTMIVFIASVLVAAVAAGVLIDTSGKLQDRSSRTGQEATEEVSSNLQYDSIVGRRDAATDAGLKDLEIYISLASGAKSVDLAQLRIQLSDGSTIKTLEHVDAAAPADGQFNVTSVRDADSSFTSAAPVINGGDLVKVTIDLATTANNMEFPPRTDVLVVLLPEVGNKVETGFTTPNSYATHTVIQLK